MKQGIHPDHVETEAYCIYGNTFTTHSTSKKGALNTDVCSEYHPFCTGKQKILDTGGHVAHFECTYVKNKKK